MSTVHALPAAYWQTLKASLTLRVTTLSANPYAYLFVYRGPLKAYRFLLKSTCLAIKYT